MDNPLANPQPQPTDLNYVAVPSDPSVKLTLEQLLSVFGGADRLNAERDLLKRLAANRVPLLPDQDAGRSA